MFVVDGVDGVDDLNERRTIASGRASELERKREGRNEEGGWTNGRMVGWMVFSSVRSFVR